MADMGLNLFFADKAKLDGHHILLSKKNWKNTSCGVLQGQDSNLVTL